MRMPRWLRPRDKQAAPADPAEQQPQYRPAQHVVVNVVLALRTPASVEAIAAAVDRERGLAPDAPVSGGTSADAVRKVLRQMADEGRVTGMRPVQWHDIHVSVPGRWDGSDWWWPTHKWDQFRKARDEARKVTPSWPRATGKDRRGQPREKSEVAKAVDRVIAANEAHYQAHKNDFGPSGS